MRTGFLAVSTYSRNSSSPTVRNNRARDRRRVTALLRDRTVALLAQESAPSTVDELYERYLMHYRGDDSVVASLRASVQASHPQTDDAKWSQAMERLRLRYSLGAPAGRPFSPLLRRHLTIPGMVAGEAVNQPLDSSTDPGRVSGGRWRELAWARVLPVGRVAADEGWFADEDLFMLV